MNNQLINDLVYITTQKLELFYRLYEITLAQEKDIDGSQADNIEALVQQKQQVIDKVGKLDESFLAGYNKLKQVLQLDSLDKVDTNKFPELKGMRNNVAQIMELAGKIMELENSNKEKLDFMFQAIKSELRQINTGKRSLKAYEAPAVNNDGIFIDKKK